MAIMGQKSAATCPVIMMELNELCPPIIEKMMAAGELPNFKRLHAKSDVHVTWTDDPDLEPWVQWVTLHTGQMQDVHGAKELDEGHRIKLPRVWDILGKRGRTSLVFGSMNGDAMPSEKVFLVPDPWSTHVEATDAAWKPFHDFISFNVTEHANKRAKPDRKTLLAFVRFMVGRGLSIATVMKAVRQLVSERTSRVDVKWGRALILDLMMWDAFEKEYQKRKPDFATFFANSTAYLQHRYWRHMQPEVYQVKPSAEEMAAYGDAIQTSYRHMDWLLGRAMRLAGPNGRIVFATGLSQEANLRYEHIGGKFVYRPHSFEDLNVFLGGPKATFEPVMTHQAWASLETSADADRFEHLLGQMQSNGASVFEWRRNENRIFFWCKFISKVDADLVITNAETGARRNFADLFGSLGQVNNSQHNRSGCFWVERDDGKGRVHDARLPLEQATALLLKMFSGGATDAPAKQAA
ncbi:MAG TPA: hypothetical protein VFV70_13930 [Hyphomonadaceae bacterium]|nr:hypothetical protein [Hyphomonadaceae bacterium]